MAVQEGDQGQRPHGSSSFTCYPTDFSLFLRSRIRDIETLRTMMGHADFVAMDTEHYDEQGFSSIGLAFASELQPIDQPIHPAAITGTSEERNMAIQQPAGASHTSEMAQSICFNIRGFERSQPTKERIWGQPDKVVEVEAIASAVTDLLQHWQCKEAGSEKPLVLVTHSSRAELTAISTLFPQICGLFSAWVDLQPLVLEVYHKHTNYPRLDGLNISLRYAMRTLGFSTGYQPGTLHHAGNDALRTLAIMACLTYENAECGRLRELEHVLRVNRYRKEQRRLRGTEKDRGLHRKRPGPPSQYPHVAKITMASAGGIEGPEQQGLDHQIEVAEGDQESDRHLFLPPVDIYRPDQTWDFFSPYEPNAIGRVCKEECYYVCVPSQTTLQQLISDLDRTSAWGLTLLAEDVSDLRALGASKREERAKRRQA